MELNSLKSLDKADIFVNRAKLANVVYKIAEDMRSFRPSPFTAIKPAF